MPTLQETKLGYQIQQLIDTHIHETCGPKLCNTPIVSVLLLTYNHKDFIREAVESVLAQETNFPYEIVIGDDCSTDGTTDIIREYQNLHPDKIRLLIADRNLYNFLPGIKFVMLYSILQVCCGKYIALLEGDDYWTSPSKLQKQIDILEANPDLAICFHRIKILENNHFKDDFIKVFSTITTIVDLAKGNYIHTPSCVFKNNMTNGILGSHFGVCPTADYYLHMMNAQYGKIYHIDEIMAVYRIHDGSTWSTRSEIYRYQKTLESMRCILLDLSDNFLQARRELQLAYINLVIHIYKYFSTDSSFNKLLPNDFENHTIKLLVDEVESLKYKLRPSNYLFYLFNKLFSIFKNRVSSKRLSVNKI